MNISPLEAIHVTFTAETQFDGPWVWSKWHFSFNKHFNHDSRTEVIYWSRREQRKITLGTVCFWHKYGEKQVLSVHNNSLEVYIYEELTTTGNVFACKKLYLAEGMQVVQDTFT